ncbi:hypothetical protein DSO57_1025830 [Entomophthora muscae]|uniref:Uncharacterized protein n=1 Tax=Entomophthora muscae TaxID=34485 RepID=A0ACC2UM27_9FUNG|nr:hypothetical protein DSO57_1025830 [Entomophthora muscae]
MSTSIMHIWYISLPVHVQAAMNPNLLKHGPSQGQDMLDFAHAPYSDLPVWKRLIAQYSIAGIEVGFRLAGYAAMCAIPVMAYLRVAPSVLSGIIAVWSISEWLFLFWSKRWIEELERRRPMPFLDPERRMKLARKVADHVDLEKALPLWSKSSTVQAKEWLAWAFFDKLKLRPAEEKQLSILQGETHRSEELQTVEMLCPTLDPLVYIPKPLIFYALVRACKYTMESNLNHIGLKKHKGEYINYWKYQSVQEATASPIIFIHGVGLGPGVYINHIHKLIEHHPNRDIYALELPCIMVGSFSDLPTMDEILASVDDFFAENRLQQCSFIGHSYGTIVCTWLNYHRPKYIANLTLVDPVCFNLFESQLIKKCLYQGPSCFIHGFSLHVVFRDPLLASVLSRNFWWHQNNLFPDDIKAKTNVYLSDMDWIIDTLAVVNYLKLQLAVNPNPNVHIHMLHMAHGEYLFNSDVLDAICQDV